VSRDCKFSKIVCLMGTLIVLSLHSLGVPPAFANKLTLQQLEQKALEDPKVARELGIRYLQGQGVIQDKKKGVMWLERAAHQGDVIAARMLYRSFNNPKSEFYDLKKSKEIEPLAQLPESKPIPNEKGPDRQGQSPDQPRWPKENLPRVEAKGRGSGFAINRNGNFITNFHVVQGCHVVVVEYQGMRARANLVALSEDDDLAVLEVPGKTEHYLPIRNVAAKLGEEVRVAGFPEGLIKISQGIVGSVLGDSLVQVSASVSSGNSGGPLVDSGGAVIGVVVGKLPAGAAKDRLRGDDYNFAIAAKKLKSLLVSSKIEHFGIDSVRPLSAEVSARLLDKISAQVLCYR
jgi:S1-C subfamily serine protease